MEIFALCYDIPKFSYQNQRMQSNLKERTLILLAW